MASIKSFGRVDGMLPLVGVAALLALYGPPASSTSQSSGGSTPRAVTAPASAAQGSSSWLEDVRPVLETMAEAMGEPASRPPDVRLAIQLAEELSSTSHQLATLDPDRRDSAASVSVADPDADLHAQRQREAADARQVSNEDLLQKLSAASNGNRSVAFAVALIPDYIDSQSGWMADHILSGIQAAFSRNGYALDRFFLPDWSGQTGDATPGPRRAHERQPGVVVFRRVKNDTGPYLYAVLVVLETPTAGPHTRALSNAIALTSRWMNGDASRAVARRIAVVGPTFSGSNDPLARMLESQLAGRGIGIDIFNGSANAPDNDRVANLSFVRYYQYITDINRLAAEATEFLCDRGHHARAIADLVDSSSFGQGATNSNSQAGTPMDSPKCSRQITDESRTFRFPLHVAQLRAASPTEPIVLSRLFGGASVPIDFTEPLPATDFLPALRPGMASPTVEVSFRSLLKAIRRDRASAVAIVATDARDVLFLAREVRRSAPSVQLLLYGAQALYLHPEYAPFLRGALVASTYPLVPALPSEPGAQSAFPSQEAQGVYLAVNALLSAGEEERHKGLRAVDDRPHAFETRDVWLSVVGSDAFWPLELPSTHRSDARPGLTSSAWLVLLLCVTFAVVFVTEAVRALYQATPHGQTGLLIPPARTHWALFAHIVHVSQAGAVVAVVTFGAACVVATRLPIQLSWQASAGIAGAVSLVLLVLAYLVVRQGARSYKAEALAAVRRRWSQVVARRGVHGLPRGEDVRLLSALGLGAVLALCTLAATAALFVWLVRDLLLSSDVQRMSTIARWLAGGVVSPVPATLLIVSSLLLAILWDRNRSTPMGLGYMHLCRHCEAFRYLMGAQDTRDANLRALVASLERPLPSLQHRRLLVILLVSTMLVITLGRGGISVDGRAFSWFLSLATFVTLVRSALLVVQTTQGWRHLDSCLGRMRSEPFMRALEAVHRQHVTWKVSLFAARVGKLRHIVKLVNRLAARNSDIVTSTCAARITSTYADELARASRRPLATSATWNATWPVAEQLVSVLRGGKWAVGGEAGRAAVTGEKSAGASVDEEEFFVALHVAHILRDMVSRLMMSMGNALTSIGLLTLAHLVYMFQGRSVYLLVDMAFLLAAACVALWLLLGIERDHVLSVLRDSKPDRIEFNAGFVKGIAGYVILPVVAALGAVFPEIGVHFMSLFEPLRRLIAD